MCYKHWGSILSQLRHFALENDKKNLEFSYDVGLEQESIAATSPQDFIRAEIGKLWWRPVGTNCQISTVLYRHIVKI